MPARHCTAVERLARRIAAEAGPGLRTLVVGRPDRRTLAVLDAALGPLTVVRDPGEAGADGGYDVGVALGWLHRLDDPGAGLAALRRVAPAHLLLGTPREPLASLGLRTHSAGRTAWSAPGFLRFASDHGAVRDVAHTLDDTLVWVRATTRPGPPRPA